MATSFILCFVYFAMFQGKTITEEVVAMSFHWFYFVFCLFCRVVKYESCFLPSLICYGEHIWNWLVEVPKSHKIMIKPPNLLTFQPQRTLVEIFPSDFGLVKAYFTSRSWITHEEGSWHHVGLGRLPVWCFFIDNKQ